MFYTRIAAASLLMLTSLALFAAPHPKAPTLNAIKNLYILDLGSSKPTILSITDTSNKTHKISIALNQADINCASLKKAVKNHHFSMEKKSVVYLAKIYKIYTLHPCEKPNGLAHR